MTKLITIEQVALLWGVNLASLKKHRPRLGMPTPAAKYYNNRLYSEQEIIDFAKRNDIAKLFELAEKREWQERKARTEAKKKSRQQAAAFGVFNVARLW
ncbi:MAG: hypothetical protein ACXWAT_00670 [Methylobacter sp.]